MPKVGSAFEPAGGAGAGAVSGAGVDSDADADAAALPRRLLAEGRNCCAETVEAVMTAPRIVVVNAEDVRRKPRLLAFLGLALPDGSSRRETSSIKDRPAPAIWHRTSPTGSISRDSDRDTETDTDRRFRDSLCGIGMDDT